MGIWSNLRNARKKCQLPWWLACLESSQRDRIESMMRKTFKLSIEVYFVHLFEFEVSFNQLMNVLYQGKLLENFPLHQNYN